MDIEKTIDHEKFDLVGTKDLSSIPHHWEETQLDFIQSNENITDNYKHLINLFSDAIDQIIACYSRYRNGKTSDFQNRIERVKGLFKTQDPYLLNWLNAESVRGNDHYNYLKFLGHNFILVFTHIGIDLTTTGIPSIINEYLKLKVDNGPKIKQDGDSEKSLTIRQIALKAIYEGKIITRQNGVKFLEGTSHKSVDRLYGKFTKYSTRINRVGDQSDREMKALAKDIEAVIICIPDNKKQQAEQELTILKSKIQ